MKTVLITGGGSGIGLALSKLLSEKGYGVICLDTMYSEFIPGVSQYEVDVSDAAALQKTLNTIPEVDILVNNAGIMRRGTLLESSEEDFDNLFRINVKGAWLVLKYAPLAVNGMLVQMSSGHALKLVADPGLYTLTKQCTATLAQVYGLTRKDITIKTLFPGPVDTPLARYDVKGEDLLEKEQQMFSPVDVAQKIVDLIESDRKQLIFNYDIWDYELQ